MKTIRVLGFVQLSVFICCLSSAANAAVIWDFHDGQLFGAQNVNVGGELYDVAFVDGSCISIFGGCDEQSDFDFNSSALAGLAAQSLLDQVLIDSNPLGQLFDSDPLLVAGCTATSACNIVIPFALFDVNTVDAALAFNATPGSGFTDGQFLAIRPSTNTFYDSGFSNATYSVWTNVSVSAVPVPAAVWLFGSGLIGLVGVARRKTIKKCA